MTEDGDANVDDAEHSYRIITFHDQRGAPPTMATSDLQGASKLQLAMRALPDLPDDPGALPIALDTDELVEALGSICSHLDEGGVDFGSTELHRGHVIVHWHLRNHDRLEGSEWLPDDVTPERVVVWWCTASLDPARQVGQEVADQLCQRLYLGGQPSGRAAGTQGRLAGATEALNGLIGDDARLAELAALTHEGTTIGIGPGRHLRIAQAVATATDEVDLWSSAMLAGLSSTEEMSERLFPKLSGEAEHDPRRAALAAAIVGWVAGVSLAPSLQVADLHQLIGPVAVVLRPQGLRYLDIGGPFADIVRTLFADDARLLQSLRPADDIVDGARLRRARLGLRVALACGWFRGARLSAPRRNVLEQVEHDTMHQSNLASLLFDACAAPLCAEVAPSLAVLRPQGLPDALWDKWVESGQSTA